MRIAVVGAGVSGLTAAYVLSRAHAVTLFEREPRLGGHAHTHAIRRGGAWWPVDSGFMVFNTRTYPHFVALLDQLGVRSRPSDMSFGVRCRRCGLEYSSVGVGGLFAQRRRLADPRHYHLLAEILRFFRAGRAALADGRAERLTLGRFLTQHRLSASFQRHFLLPMTGAIWSASPAAMQAFPAASLLRFLDNHGLLAASGQPTWRTIVGGSRAYVDAIARALAGGIRVADPVVRLSRDARGAWVTTASGVRAHYDAVVLATHADEALAVLADPTAAEEDALRRFRYSVNDTWLHGDAAHLPAVPAARASWNCELTDCRDETSAVSVTYDLNRLQGHEPGEPILCTLNPMTPVGGAVHARLTYTHPILDRAAIEGQARLRRLNGQQRTYYAGAHLGYGFHEDGVRSALDVTRAFGLDLSTPRAQPAVEALPA